MLNSTQVRIIFENYDGIQYCVAYNARIGDYIHEEVVFAEVSEGLGAHKVTWLDAFDKPEFFDTFDLARKHVLANHNLHKPHSQSKSYYVGK